MNDNSLRIKTKNEKAIIYYHKNRDKILKRRRKDIKLKVKKDLNL